jgi:hypothetical protein
MSRRVGTVILVLAAIAAVVAVLARSGDSTGPPRPRAVAATGDQRAPASRPAGAVEDCSTRSEADFPGAFSDPRNLVVGPLVLIGGAYTPASTVDEFGGNKFPLLVKAGHRVTVRLAGGARRSAGLAYGPLPQGETRVRDTYRTVTFIACRPGKATQEYRPDGPSGTYADGAQVTFWSGFVLTRRPDCIPLEVYVDGATAPLHASLALGRRCDA